MIIMEDCVVLGGAALVLSGVVLSWQVHEALHSGLKSCGAGGGHFVVGHGNSVSVSISA